MICRCELTKIDYEYSFEEGGNVRLKNPSKDFIIPYEDWCDTYTVINKWKKLM